MSATKAFHRLLPVVVAVAVLFTATADVGASPHPKLRADPRSGLFNTEVVLEGGIAVPFGDLGDDWLGTEQGLGAELGFDIGFRYRYFVTPRLAVSPAFHYEDFGDYLGNGVDGAFETRASIFRYALDVQFMPLRGDDSLVQPYVSGGIALLRCRYSDEWLELDELPFETASNCFGFSLGGGVRVQTIELSAIYELARFDTSSILGDGLSHDFNWDHLVVRAGLVFPTW